MPDITPRIPEGRQIVQAYGDGLFRISGQAFDTPVLVFPEQTLVWSITSFADISVESLASVYEHAPKVEVLLFGCGDRMMPIPKVIKSILHEWGISADPMDTGAACRTYNVLNAEDRRCCAALIPV